VKRLVVVENASLWPFDLEGAEVVAARDYLTEARYAELRSAIVFNVCRAYRYQSLGYYVSLLATARGHRPLPSVETLQDVRLSSVVRVIADDLDDDMQRVLSHLRSERFELSVYFGRNLAKRYDALSRALFDQFPAPFLRATFVYEDRWKLQSIRPIATGEIPETHREFVIDQARSYFARPRRPRKHRTYRYDMAILYDPADPTAPSDEVAIRRFIRAARELEIDAETIDRNDHRILGEYDALFLRETTAVNHHTYRMARRAAAEDLVVIDDPESIVRCTNKVFQAELFARNGIDSPETVVVHERNVELVREVLGFPCVLKRPDSSFSQGVIKVNDEKELEDSVRSFFADSQLLVAQRFVPSDFDWRIGVLGGGAFYGCKYHMARGHWQIVKAGEGSTRQFGRVEALPLDKLPASAIDVAVRAARLIGDGLYGVDVKEVDGRFLVMEVNDNPTLESGEEDAVLGEALYLSIAQWFRDRLDARGRRSQRS
jgi:glutathione synthase/RimK-type ligase-like ATP-grasp enzyme